MVALKRFTVFWFSIFLLVACAGQEKNSLEKTGIMKENNPDKIVKTEEEWKKDLSPEQFRILRQKGTELPFSGKFYKNKEKGMYVCAACGAELFSSESKYDSGCGWPSFFESLKDKVDTAVDKSLGMTRIEITCHRCGSHLGHVFDDGPKPTGLRYCVNSLSLDFRKKKD